MIETAVSYAHTHHQQFLDQLCAFLRIPSISTLSQHKPDIVQAANWLKTELSRIGLEHVSLIETNGNPVVYADWLHAGVDAITLLVYGH